MKSPVFFLLFFCSGVFAATQSFTTIDPFLLPVESVARETVISVPVSGTVNNVDVEIQMSNSDFMEEISIKLTSPSGTLVEIMSGDPSLCSTFATFSNPQVFSDSGAPFSCTSPSPMQPFLPLSAFDGEEIFGDWTLAIEDVSIDDGNFFNQWTLYFDFAPSTIVCGNFDNSIYDEDLSSWVVEGDPATWTFSGSPVQNTAFLQTHTDEPTYLVTPRNGVTTMKGTMSVATTSDDDFIGLVFASGTRAIIFSWKQSSQIICSSTGASGGTELLFTWSYGTLVGVGTCDYWLYRGTVTPLQNGMNFGNIGWADNTQYRFTAQFTSSHITIYINDMLEFDYDISSLPAAFGSAFPMDKIGFYAFSQNNVQFSDIQLFSVQSIVGCAPAEYRSYFDPESCSPSDLTAQVDYGDSTPVVDISPTIPPSGLPYFDISRQYTSTGSYTMTVELFYLTTTTGNVDTIFVLSSDSPFASISLSPDPAAQCGFDVTCAAGGSATLIVDSVTGGAGTPYTGSWSHLGSSTFDPIANPTQPISAPGAYSLEVEDTRGCTYTTASVIASSSSISSISASLGSACGTASVSATGNCGPFTFSWSDSVVTTSTSRSGLGIGTYSVSAVDQNQCASGTSNSITIVDQPPTARCISTFTAVLDPTGSNTIVTSDIDNGSTDPCNMLSLSMDSSSFVNANCAAVGTPQTSTLIASGYSQFSTDSCSTIVNVVDTTDPIAICQNIELNFPGGSYTVNPSDLDGGSSDACGYTLSASPAVFTNFGSYVVTLTVTDPSGNSNSCQSTVSLIGLRIESPLQAEDVFMYVPFLVEVSFYLPYDSTMRIDVIEESSGTVYRSLSGNALTSSVEITFFKTMPGVYRIEAYSEQTSVVSVDNPRISLCASPHVACNYGL